jgi:hypothetical protein
MYNPKFKVVEFDRFKSEAGLPAFVLSPSKWVEKTSAIGISSKSSLIRSKNRHDSALRSTPSAASPAQLLGLG